MLLAGSQGEDTPLMRTIRRLAPIVILALLCSALMPSHAAATGGDSLFDGDDLLDNDAPSGTTTDDGDSTDEESPSPGSGMPEELAPEGPVGPVGIVDVPTYRAIWEPGGVAPSDLNLVHGDDDVDLLAVSPEDGSYFMALLIIRDEDAPTEYRFENAVPAGHQAEVQADGSVTFFDADGNEVGSIGAPWAVDALDKPVVTSYRLDGSTLVQTVDHDGAAYPVVADPIWAGVVYAGRVCAAYPQCVNAVVTVARFAPATTAYVVGSAWSARTWFVTGNGGGSGNRPTNSCNMRNRQGC